MTVKRFKTRPCEIEAVQWTGANIKEIQEFTRYKALFSTRENKLILSIPTLEGVMEARITDYIVKGLKGEFYPCRLDCFNKKYEEV